MGADNTMIILKNRNTRGELEFRVALVAGAENLVPLENESTAQLMARRWFILTWFRTAAVYGNSRKARNLARRRLSRLRMRRRIVEYGVRTLNLSFEPFPEESLQAVEDWLRQRKVFPFQTTGFLPGRRAPRAAV
ncbi:MAG: hypothetical protein K2X27_22725 [Candidatus Obscuribacterales bacterium]|nr:hypothetical protein [Candidatus Obscuribacterales bacterium]